MILSWYQHSHERSQLQRKPVPVQLRKQGAQQWGRAPVSQSRLLTIWRRNYALLRHRDAYFSRLLRIFTFMRQYTIAHCSLTNVLGTGVKVSAARGSFCCSGFCCLAIAEPEGPQQPTGSAEQKEDPPFSSRSQEEH